MDGYLTAIPSAIGVMTLIMLRELTHLSATAATGIGIAASLAAFFVISGYFMKKKWPYLHSRRK